MKDLGKISRAPSVVGDGKKGNGSASSSMDAFLEGWATGRAQGRERVDIERCLSSADVRLGRLIDHIVATAGARRFQKSNAHSHFEAIARSIVYQQLSKKAAATIYGRFSAVLGGTPTPANVLSAREGDLQSAGLSTGKVRFVRELARSVFTGEVDLDCLDELGDDDVVATLTKLPGIGVWTAQMFLMFRLKRLDVLPTEDVGIQKGLQIAHDLRRAAAPGYVARCGRKWAPYRSIACLYLWAAVDLRVELATVSPPSASSRCAREADKQRAGGRGDP